MGALGPQAVLGLGLGLGGICDFADFLELQLRHTAAILLQICKRILGPEQSGAAGCD